MESIICNLYFCSSVCLDAHYSEIIGYGSKKFDIMITDRVCLINRRRSTAIGYIIVHIETV